MNSELLGFGLCLSSGILKDRKHNDSETLFSSSDEEGDTYFVGSLRKSLLQSLINPCPIHYSYLINRNQAISKRGNRNICNKNCDKASTFVEIGQEGR
jgi:hypothetical protein